MSSDEEIDNTKGTKKYHCGWECLMALIFNNLLINKNSKRYTPFLVNLVSGRRRLLNPTEYELISSMLNKDNLSNFSDSERILYDKLIDDKQFVTDTQRSLMEDIMVQSGMFNPNLEPSDNLDFTIAITMECNMNCIYCYERGFRDRSTHMNRKHIDAIYDFYAYCRNEYGAKGTVDIIGITGGEPLINRETTKLIKYVSEKWRKSKVSIITNGVNLLKYYDELPLGKSMEVIVSLDGLKDIHLARRFSGKPVVGNVYDDIISGVKKLLNDQITVKIQSVLDKNNYFGLPEFRDFLTSEGIINHPNCSFVVGYTLDYSNHYNIDENFNDKQEIRRMQEYMLDSNFPYVFSFLGLSKLFKLIGRPANEPFIPKHNFCNTSFLSNCFFVPNGKIYFCHCFDEDKGIVGTYYPKVSLCNDAINQLSTRSVMKHEKCRRCPYKFVCLGNCPKVQECLGEEMTCGVYLDSDIMDNLEYNYQQYR